MCSMPPPQSISKTMWEAEEQSSKYSPFNLFSFFLLLNHPLFYYPFPQVPAYLLLLEREAGNIEDLTDLLGEDWSQFGSTCEMGKKTAKFFRMELENTWGSKHLAVFDKEEARNWILGVSITLPI